MEIDNDIIGCIIIALLIFAFALGLMFGYYLSYKEVAKPLMECGIMLGYIQALNITFGGL